MPSPGPSSPRRRCALLAVACGLAAALTSGCGESTLHGATATVTGTIPPPLARAWTAAFAHATGAKVDVRLTDGRAAAGTMQLPVALDPLAIAYRIVRYDGTSVPSGMRLDLGTLAVIFRGKVESWINDGIVGLNKPLHLPDHLITVCHRTDPAYETNTLSTYIGEGSRWWSEGVGMGPLVRWRVVGHFRVPMVPVRGADGMARCLHQRYGSIGYMDAAEAARNHFAVALVENHVHGFAGPTAAAATLAAQNVEVPPDLHIHPINGPAVGSYPLTEASYAQVAHDLCRAGLDARRATTVKAWLTWVLGDKAQAIARRLGYGSPSTYLRGLARRRVAALRCDGRPIG